MTRLAPRFLPAAVLGLLACTPTLNLAPIPGPADAAAGDVAAADRPTAVDAPSSVDAPPSVDAPMSVDAPTSVDVPAGADVPPPEDVPALPDIPILTDVPDGAATGSCARASDCAAPFSTCDTVNRRCVQCLTAAQCGAGQVCVGTRCQTPVACQTSRTCMGLVCDTARMVCVECLSGVDCPTGQVCRAQSCAPPAPTCMSSRQCSMFDQVCDLTRMVCVDCVDDRDCAMGTLCGPESVCRPQVCTPNATSCVSPSRQRSCDARGAAQTERDCGGNETCAGGRCQARVCAPGALSCASATQAQRCNPDGLGFTPDAVCPSGQTCSQGMCSACDGDGDGDDDGLNDAAEAARGTDRCNRDTDGDGATDLVEALAGTNPLVRGSVPNALFLEVPFDAGGASVNAEFNVTATRRALDVFFVVDTTGSMDPTLMALRNNASTVTSTILSTIGGGADVRFGVADFRDFGSEATAMGQDYAMRVQSPLSADQGAFAAGLGRLTLGNGGDAPEALVPALHSLVEGSGYPAYLGTATRRATAMDCGGDARGIGWACHIADRLAVFVTYSDAGWHNPPGSGSNFWRTSAPSAPLYGDLVLAMRRAGARYIGIDVGTVSAHLGPSISLARDTDSFDNTGSPTAYGGSVTGTLTRVANTLAGFTAPGRPDYTARGAADPTATGLPTGRNSGEFVRAVNTVRGAPAAPTGFAGLSGGTFSGVAAGTVLTYNAVLRNDFVPAAPSDQAFPVAVLITAGGYPVDRRTLWIVVPAR
jgi:hypothetical protein